MAYPTAPVTFVQVTAGENRSDVANMIGAEITAIETALLHPAAQMLTAPIRMRQDGNSLEWGPAAAGHGSTLGSTGGKSFLGLGCEMYPGAASKFTTRGQAGIVLTGDGAGGLLVQSVPAVSAINQTPVTRLVLPKLGGLAPSNPVIGSYAQPSVSVPSGGGAYTNVGYPGPNTDPWGVQTFDASGNFKVPVGMGGVYLWVAAVQWAGNVSGNRGVRIYLSGTGLYSQDWQLPDNVAAGAFNQQAVLVRTMAAGELLQVQLLQSSGVALTAAVTVRMVKLL